MEKEVEEKIISLETKLAYMNKVEMAVVISKEDGEEGNFVLTLSEDDIAHWKKEMEENFAVKKPQPRILKKSWKICVAICLWKDWRHWSSYGNETMSICSATSTTHFG